MIAATIPNLVKISMQKGHYQLFVSINIGIDIIVIIVIIIVLYK